MHSSHLHDLVKLRTQPLAISPAGWSTIASLDPMALAGRVPTASQPGRRVGAAVSNGREVIQLHGVYEGGNPGLLSYLGMGFNAARVTQQLRLAAMDDKVDEIVLDLNSPGGAVEGIPELVAELRKVGRTKATTAFVHYQACSAAYWLAAQCDRIVCSPSGECGSIGVYAAHTDESKALDMAGVKITLISAGKYKTEGTPTRPLDASAAARMQKDVNRIYDQFVADVADGRNVSSANVLKNYGQGRVLSAEDAKRAGMVDYVAASVEAAPINAAIAMKRTNALARRM